MSFTALYPRVLGSIPRVSTVPKAGGAELITVNKTSPVTNDPQTKAMQNFHVFSYSQTMGNPLIAVKEKAAKDSEALKQSALDAYKQGSGIFEQKFNSAKDTTAVVVEKGKEIIGEKTQEVEKWADENLTDEEKQEFAMKAYNFGKPVIAPFLGFEYNAEGDYFYTNETSMQSYAEFMDLIEYGGNPLGMDISTEIIPFKTSKYEYRIQLWKGNYGFKNAIGAEIGIYYRPLWIAEKMPYEGDWGREDLLDWYACVPEELHWRLIQEIYLKEDNSRILINDTANYAENGDHFWNLSIKLEIGTKLTADDIYVIDTFFIDDPALYKPFVAAMNDHKNGISRDKDREKELRMEFHTNNLFTYRWE